MELESSHSYLAMAAWFESTPYSGFTSWMHKQSLEERAHAMKFFDYLNSRGNGVELKAIPAPKNKYKNPLDVFKTSLKQEQAVSKSIRAIYEVAQETKDFETLNFLGWFLEEQIEEEKATQDMIDKLEVANGEPSALLRLDAAASQRE